MAFIYAKNSLEKVTSRDPLEVLAEALLRAVEGGFGPQNEVAGISEFGHLKVVDLGCLAGSPPRHLEKPKKPSEAEFKRLVLSIRRAFAELAKQGFYAVENYGHCSDCALAEIVQEAQAKKCPKRVSYTSFETAQMREIGVCTVRYGLAQSASTAAQRECTRKVGNEVQHALKEQGLAVAWDGDPEVAIRVRLKEE